jgi:hypothetical protein
VRVISGLTGSGIIAFTGKDRRDQLGAGLGSIANATVLGCRELVVGAPYGGPYAYGETMNVEVLCEDENAASMPGPRMTNAVGADDVMRPSGVIVLDPGDLDMNGVVDERDVLRVLASLGDGATIHDIVAVLDRFGAVAAMPSVDTDEEDGVVALLEAIVADEMD